jgi:hypothetical protein
MKSDFLWDLRRPQLRHDFPERPAVLSEPAPSEPAPTIDSPSKEVTLDDERSKPSVR